MRLTSSQFYSEVQFRLNTSSGFSQSSLGNFSVDADGVTGGRFVRTTDSKVGVGVSNPTANLDVSGTTKISSTLSIGGHANLSSTTHLVGAAVASSTLSIAGHANITSSVYVGGNVSATYYFGDGSNLTNVSASSISSLDDVSDTKVGGSNFTGSFLNQCDQEAPTTGTLDSANDNIGIGRNVLDAITSGDGNIGFGFDVLTDLTTGSNNVALGYDA